MVSIAVAWKSGNTSPLVRGFVDLVRQSSGAPRLRRRRPSGAAAPDRRQQTLSRTPMA